PGDGVDVLDMVSRAPRDHRRDRHRVEQAEGARSPRSAPPRGVGLKCRLHEGRSARHVELDQKSRDDPLDSVWSDAELGGNLLVREPADETIEHLALTRREARIVGPSASIDEHALLSTKRDPREERHATPPDAGPAAGTAQGCVVPICAWNVR